MVSVMIENNPVYHLVNVYKLSYFQISFPYMFYRKAFGKNKTLKPLAGLPWWLSGTESKCQWKRHRFDP